MSDDETIAPYNPSLLDAIKESARMFGQLSPVEAGLETTLPTEPLHDYLENPPADAGWLRRQTKLLSAFVPGTRGEAVGAVAEALPAVMGGAAAKAAAPKQTVESILKRASLAGGRPSPGRVNVPIPKGLSREAHRAAYRKAVQEKDWADAAGGVFTDWAGPEGLGSVAKQALMNVPQYALGKAAHMLPDLDFGGPGDWARSLRKKLGGPDYLDPNYVAPGAEE